MDMRIPFDAEARDQADHRLIGFAERVARTMAHSGDNGGHIVVSIRDAIFRSLRSDTDELEHLDCSLSWAACAVTNEDFTGRKLWIATDPAYFAPIPASLTIGHHFSMSALWQAASASGVCCSREKISNLRSVMLLDRVDEARPLYLRSRGERVDAKRTGETLILQDFASLRKTEFTHPLMSEIERLFAAGG
jgi:hypothetical protein